MVRTKEEEAPNVQVDEASTFEKQELEMEL